MTEIVSSIQYYLLIFGEIRTHLSKNAVISGIITDVF